MAKLPVGVLRRFVDLLCVAIQLLLGLQDFFVRGANRLLLLIVLLFLVLGQLLGDDVARFFQRRQRIGLRRVIGAGQFLRISVGIIAQERDRPPHAIRRAAQ